MKIVRDYITIVISLLLLGGLGACDKSGPAESAGKNIDQSIDAASEKINDAADKVSESISDNKK